MYIYKVFCVYKMDKIPKGLCGCDLDYFEEDFAKEVMPLKQLNSQFKHWYVEMYEDEDNEYEDYYNKRW